MVKKIYALLFIFLFQITTISLLSIEEFYEKPQFVTYKFPDEKLPRHSFVRFPQAGMMISSYCVYKSGNARRGRECGAWKPYEYIRSGSLVALIREKGFFSKGDSPKQIAFLVCAESGGTVETEANEYNPNGREVELEDFCSFKDGSMTSFNFILLYIARKSPNIRTEIEKVRKDRMKILSNPPAKTN